MNAKQLLPGLLILLSSCSDHNPDHPLNPESDSYVGDSLAQLDADSNDVADILERSSSSAISSEESSSTSDQDVFSSGTFSSSVILISSSLETSSAQAISSTEAHSSGLEGSCSSLQTSNASVSSEDQSSSNALTSSSETVSSSSRENSSSSSLASLYILTVDGGLTQDGADSGAYAAEKLITVTASLADSSGLCFTGWSSNVDLDVDDLTENPLYFRMPAATVHLIAQTESCITEFTDARDSAVYKVTNLNDTLWMGENLAYASLDSSWCYENETANCDSLGRLYIYDSATVACPAGWRLPTVEELLSAASRLDLQKAGNRATDSTFEQLGNYGFYWTSGPYSDATNGNSCSTADSTICAAAVVLNSSSTYSQRDKRYHGFSVRCIYDK
ncbi:MAG TPA: FISUMP domain-containing protein [Fibrobacteraceae bacterium]|nr:FISUMP domain-containing protein [Fibrobacteraceae bacterium]